jgi:hypothetical protein
VVVTGDPPVVVVALPPPVVVVTGEPPHDIAQIESLNSSVKVPSSLNQQDHHSKSSLGSSVIMAASSSQVGLSGSNGTRFSNWLGRGQAICGLLCHYCVIFQAKI